MKIKFWDRVILFLGALLTILTGGYVMYDGINALLEKAGGWARILVGAPTVFFGVYLLLFPRKFSYRRNDFVVQQTDNGELRIAVKAIENLVQKCIDMHDEIHVVSMRIRNGRDGVTVDLCISLANNIAIPLAVASLQKQIKQYLVASSGIEVREVRVSVETAQHGVGESPYLVSDQPTAERQPEPQKKGKTPLHQRIFGKGEQQVTVPEPPKAEEIPAAQEEADILPETPAEETAEQLNDQETEPEKEAAVHE